MIAFREQTKEERFIDFLTWTVANEYRCPIWALMGYSDNYAWDPHDHGDEDRG